ncbi:MAG: hypothetical protein U0Z26_12935 [Anaerolineales bacterium]
MKKIIYSFFGFLFLIGCSSTESAPPLIPSQPTATAVRVLPTFSSAGNSILWQGLQVTMKQAEIVNEFVTDFGSIRNPSPGDKFLWVHVLLKNVSQNEIRTPLLEHYSALYVATELKPTYGHRKDYTDYTVLDATIFPNQEVEAWLRFDIPVAAELNELRFVFLPESSNVGVSFSSPTFPYAEDHPTFVWNCEL